MRTYQIAYSATASANDAAHVDIRFNGTIVGIDWTIAPSGAPATNETLAAELSFNSTLQSANDVPGVISACNVTNALTTSGAVGCMGVNRWVGPMAVPVKQGDRVYLNVNETGSNTWAIRCILHVR